LKNGNHEITLARGGLPTIRSTSTTDLQGPRYCRRTWRRQDDDGQLDFAHLGRGQLEFLANHIGIARMTAKTFG
jgi:hypothetical protein